MQDIKKLQNYKLKDLNIQGMLYGVKPLARWKWMRLILYGRIGMEALSLQAPYDQLPPTALIYCLPGPTAPVI